VRIQWFVHSSSSKRPLELHLESAEPAASRVLQCAASQNSTSSSWMVSSSGSSEHMHVHSWSFISWSAWCFPDYCVCVPLG
jgi:hypothetical protein